MKNGKSAFQNDMRGVGGQKQVQGLMLGHYSAMINAKPSFSTREPMRVHVSK